MAGRQLGKLRQWAGEVISSRDKTSFTDEFRELEKDVELRKSGLDRLCIASEAYYHVLSKKKDCEALEDPEKLLPVDALGIVMITHGEEFGQDSSFGAMLVKLGRAHCKIATLQEAFALTFRDTFVASVDKFTDEIKEYEHHRKKLESRRLAYDAATSKLEKLKSSKKEKDRMDAEEELERSKQRYEETSEDVRAHMHSIQDNEIDQQRELNAFLNLEMGFVQQYLDVLKETRHDWPGTNLDSPRRPLAPERSFTRPAKEPKEPIFSAARLKRSTSTRSNPQPSPVVASDNSQSSDDEAHATPRSRRPSTHHRTMSNASKPSESRPGSRASRKRTDSVGTAGGKEEREKADKSMRMSVAGWASNAVGSVTGRGKRNKDKDKFSTLQDDDDGGESDSEGERGMRSAPVHKSPSIPSIRLRRNSTKSKDSPKLPPRILKPSSMQEAKIVRALYAFAGSSDELTFKVGDEIAVLSEVLEGWWMGELDGRKGLFPTSYTEPVSKPSLSHRREKDTQASDRVDHLSDDDAGHHAGYRSSDLSEDEAYGVKPLSPAHNDSNYSSPFFGGPTDAASIMSSVADEDDERGLIPSLSRHTESDIPYQSQSQSLSQSQKALSSLYPAPPVVRRSSTTDILSGALYTPPKKAPPPPPPRRSTGNPLSGPPLPMRPGLQRGQSSSVKSSSSSSLQAAPRMDRTPTSSISSHDSYDASPFESVDEITKTGLINGSSATTPSGCGAFKQNPFKPKGMCSNCFQIHR